jgi:hypothetical protein
MSPVDIWILPSNRLHMSKASWDRRLVESDLIKTLCSFWKVSLFLSSSAHHARLHCAASLDTSSVSVSGPFDIYSGSQYRISSMNNKDPDKPDASNKSTFRHTFINLFRWNTEKQRVWREMEAQCWLWSYFSSEPLRSTGTVSIGRASRGNLETDESERPICCAIYL